MSESPTYAPRNVPRPHAARWPQIWNTAMLDVLYILIGAAFLGACALYAIACDHL